MFVNSYSVFGVRCSVFGVRCSVFSVRCSVFGVRCSVFDVREAPGVCVAVFSDDVPDYKKFLIYLSLNLTFCQQINIHLLIHRFQF